MRRSRLLPIRPMWFMWALGVFAVSPWYVYFVANGVQSYGEISGLRFILIAQGFLFMGGSALYMLYSAVVRMYELITDRDVIDDTGRISFFADTQKPQELWYRRQEVRTYRAGSDVKVDDIVVASGFEVNPYNAQGACDLVNHQ